MGSGTNDWVTKLIRRFEAINWTVTKTKQSHFKVRTHDGRMFMLPGTSSDYRAQLNTLSDARKFGFEEREEAFRQRAEDDRLARLERNRAQSAKKIAAIMAANDEEKREDVTQREKAVEEGALGYVDGVAIAERAPATYIPSRGGGRRPAPDCDELLLMDGTVQFQCLKQDNGETCSRTFGSAQGVIIHASKYAHRSNTRPVKTAKPRVKLVEQPQKQPGVVARVVRLTEDVDALVDELDRLGDATENIRDELRELAATLPDEVNDSTTREKARMYDELGKFFKQ